MDRDALWQWWSAVVRENGWWEPGSPPPRSEFNESPPFRIPTTPSASPPGSSASSPVTPSTTCPHTLDGSLSPISVPNSPRALSGQTTPPRRRLKRVASSQSGVSELQTPLKVLKVLKVAGSDEAKEEKEQDKTPETRHQWPQTTRTRQQWRRRLPLARCAQHLRAAAGKQRRRRRTRHQWPLTTTSERWRQGLAGHQRLQSRLGRMGRDFGAHGEKRHEDCAAQGPC